MVERICASAQPRGLRKIKVQFNEIKIVGVTDRGGIGHMVYVHGMVCN